MKYEVNNSSIESLVSWINQGEIAIPEMQRPFVWNNSKVRDLIDSLYKSYPIGYIITWRNPDVKLKDGTIASGKKVIIDGQQRITALIASIAGQQVIGDNYKKKSIKIAFNPIEQSFAVLNPALEKSPMWISDISEVFKNDFSERKFLRRFCSENQDVIKKYFDDNNLKYEDSDDFEDMIADNIIRLKMIKNNSIGIIELSPNIDIETVTEIFIRINSQGVPLSQADFAMSKISSNERFKGDIIRKTIDYFCHLAENPVDYQVIKENDTDFVSTNEFKSIKWIVDESEDIYLPDYNDVLRVAFTFKFNRGKLEDLVSLLSGRDFITREFKDSIAEDSFRLLYEGVMSFVNQTNYKRFMMIVKSVGIIDKRLIRSKNVLNFAYILYLKLKDRKIDANIIENAVRRWIVLSILTSRYSSSPESWFDYDIKRFNEAEDVLMYIENIEKGELSDAFWETSLVDKLNTSVASSPYFNVFIMSQIKNSNRGFLSKAITVKSLIEERGDVHHIFPKNYLKSNGIKSKGDYNQVANYVYTQSEINIKIKDKAPKTYFDEILKQCENSDLVYGDISESDDLIKNLEENAIPEDIYNMDVVSYNNFLEKRRKLMALKIKEYYMSLI